MRERPKTLARRLDTRVEIQAPPSADDAALQSDEGEVDRSEDNWTEVGQAWAEVLPDTGGEVIVGDQAVGRQRGG